MGPRFYFLPHHNVLCVNKWLIKYLSTTSISFKHRYLNCFFIVTASLDQSSGGAWAQRIRCFRKQSSVPRVQALLQAKLSAAGLVQCSMPVDSGKVKYAQILLSSNEFFFNQPWIAFELLIFSPKYALQTLHIEVHVKFINQCKIYLTNINF